MLILNKSIDHISIAFIIYYFVYLILSIKISLAQLKISLMEVFKAISIPSFGLAIMLINFLLFENYSYNTSLTYRIISIIISIIIYISILSIFNYGYLKEKIYFCKIKYSSNYIRSLLNNIIKR